MRRSIGWAAMCGVLLVGCASGPHVRPGPPLKLTFAPPPGMRFLIQAREKRYSAIVFPSGATVGSTVSEDATIDETYKALPRGGYLVTETLINQSLARDGDPLQPAIPLVDISLQFTVDAQGRFIEAVNVPEAIRAIRSRARTKLELKFLDTTLTPDSIVKPLKSAWEARVKGLCNRAVSPGKVSYGLDETAIAVPSPIPVRTVMRDTVLGSTEIGGKPGLEVSIDLGGSESEMVQAPAAQNFLETVDPGRRVLTPTAQGHGSRFVTLNDCQIVLEQSVLEGTVPLQFPVNLPAKVKPKEVRFKITREVRRVIPSGNTAG